MMVVPPFIHGHAGHADWRVALAECRRQLIGRGAGIGSPYTLGWCYFTDYHAGAAEAILQELHGVFPGVQWVGTDGVGVAASGIEYFDEPGIVLMLAALAPETFRLFSGRRPLAGQESGFSAHTALVHSDGTTPGLQDLIRELSANTATGYLFGGLSSARRSPVHLAEGVFSGGLSGVLFSGEVGLISRVTQGCQPIGPVRRITSAQDNYVLTLDDQPALDSLLSDLDLDPDLDGDELIESLGPVLVGLSIGADDTPHWPGQFGSDTQVRHLIGVDPRHRVLAVAEHIVDGTRLAFCSRNPESARGDLVRIATEIRDQLESGAGTALGALYVSCSGRGGPHFGERHGELRTLRQALGEVPLVGFFAGGEIARDRLYGYTGVLTVFTGEST
jgi:small ligand-binding sensory domain FIST